MSRPGPHQPWPTGTTRLVALLGWPARYSLSPALHNAAFAEHHLDLAYLVTPTREGDLVTVVQALGAMGAVGANVTVPHKQAVVALCDNLTAEAELVGAVNTLAWTTEGLLGDNTDAAGLVDALTAEVAVAPGDRLVVLGSGGAARAVAVAAGRLKAHLTVVARRPDAAAEVARLGAAAGAVAGEAVDLADEAALTEAVGAGRLIVNATPLGMEGERLPEAFHQLRADQVAYDLIYDPPYTPFLRSAADAGAGSHHGIGMLVAQAAASYRRWTGREAPTGVMSAAAVAAVAERARTG